MFYNSLVKEFAEKWVLSLHPFPVLRSVDGVPAQLKNPKLLRLVGRLADSDQPVHRSVLAEEFWPRPDHALPRENLRAAVYSIKKACGDDLLVLSGDSLAIRPGSVRLTHPLSKADKGKAKEEFVLPNGLTEALESGAKELGSILLNSEFELELAPVDLGISFLSSALEKGSLGSSRPRVKAMWLYLKTVEGTSSSHLREIDALCEHFRSSSDLAGLFRIAMTGSHTHLSSANMKVSRAYALTAVEAAELSKNPLNLGQAYLALALVNAHDMRFESARDGFLKAAECFEQEGNSALTGTAAMLQAEVAFSAGDIKSAAHWIAEMERCFAMQSGRIHGWGEIQKGRLDRASGRQDDALERLTSATQLTQDQTGFSAHARAFSEMSLLLEEQGEVFESAVHLGYSDRYRWKFRATATELERRTTRALRARLRTKLNPSEQRSARRIAARRVESAFQNRSI